MNGIADVEDTVMKLWMMERRGEKVEQERRNRREATYEFILGRNAVSR